MSDNGFDSEVKSKLAQVISDLKNSGKIGAEDVQGMRMLVFGDGYISISEAEALFDLNANCYPRDVSWNLFFIEALTDFMVRQVEPSGYVTVENSGWLISMISKDGCVESDTELDLLINILDQAKWSPESLVSFALNQVKQAVIEGDGPIAKQNNLVRGFVGETEVNLLRKILYAFGVDGGLAITKTEAEILFDINDATADAENHPNWSDLFVKAIANHIMSGSGYAVPNRQEALRREVWLDSEDTTGGFLSKMISRGGTRIFESYVEQSPEEAALARLEEQRLEIITGEKITGSEAAWLIDRIGRDGIFHENEKALLIFIKEESPDLHPSLKPLLEKAA